jgi:selenoprotein W-related protein
LAAAIRDEFDVEAELVKGDNGIFDVEVDGRNIFSKHEVGRFPENDEVLALLRQ